MAIKKVKTEGSKGIRKPAFFSKERYNKSKFGSFLNEHPKLVRAVKAAVASMLIASLVTMSILYGVTASKSKDGCAVQADATFNEKLNELIEISSEAGEEAFNEGCSAEGLETAFGLFVAKLNDQSFAWDGTVLLVLKVAFSRGYYFAKNKYVVPEFLDKEEIKDSGESSVEVGENKPINSASSYKAEVFNKAGEVIGVKVVENNNWVEAKLFNNNGGYYVFEVSQKTVNGKVENVINVATVKAYSADGSELPVGNLMSGSSGAVKSLQDAFNETFDSGLESPSKVKPNQPVGGDEKNQ